MRGFVKNETTHNPEKEALGDLELRLEKLDAMVRYLCGLEELVGSLDMEDMVREVARVKVEEDERVDEDEWICK